MQCTYIYTYVCVYMCIYMITLVYTFVFWIYFPHMTEVTGAMYHYFIYSPNIPMSQRG
jgi:hypothetical protein